MIDIAKLLICEGKPSQELIDYQVDATVKRMIDDHFINKNSGLNAEYFHEDLFDIQKTFDMSDNKLCIYTQSQYFDDVINDVEKSILRYSPFLQFHPQAEDPRKQKDNHAFKNPKKDPKKVIGIGFCLLLEITPEMKKAFLLEKELPQKDLRQSKKLKI